MLGKLIFQDADHPEQAARQVAGLIRLGACYSTIALQAAASAALSANVWPTNPAAAPAYTRISRHRAR